MKKANQIIYGIFGALAILFGVVALLFPGTVISEADRTGLVMHLLREEGAAGIFIGLMAIWCIFNYEKRVVVHYFLIVFAFLMAAIHWLDYLTGHRQLMSPLINTVPFMLLVLMSRSQTTAREG